MKRYRKTSHSVYDIKIHFVWITKYRKPVLFGDVAIRVRDLIREICNSMDIEIIKGYVSKDHVHLFVSVPQYHSVSDVMQSIKGKTSRKLLSESRMLSKNFWGCHLWARGYFVASSGNVTDEVIAEYIELQGQQKRDRDDDFTIDGVDRLQTTRFEATGLQQVEPSLSLDAMFQPRKKSKELNHAKILLQFDRKIHTSLCTS